MGNSSQLSINNLTDDCSLFTNPFYEDWILIKLSLLMVCNNDYSPFSILCPIYIRVFLPGYFSMATQRDPILIEIFDLDNNEVAREQRRKSQPQTQSGIVVNSLTRARRPSPFEINVKHIYKKYTSDFFFFVENDEIH